MKRVALGTVADIIAGQSPAGKFYNTVGGGTPFYQGKKDFGEKFIEPATVWTKQTTKLAKSGDVLMSVRAPVGPVNFATEDICIGRGLAAIRSKSGIDREFLFYQLQYLQPEIAGNEGAVFASISKAQIEALPIVTPPLSEQKRIVAILDEAFAGVAIAKTNAEKNLQNARDLFDAKLAGIFQSKAGRWPKKTLREVAADFGRGKSKHRPRNDPKLYGGAYPFIQTGDVRGANHVITEHTQTYSEDGLAQSKLWPAGTLCITIAANIAETGILGFDACFPDSVIGVVADPKQTSNRYLEYLLQSVKADLKAKGKGSAQDNINLATFENERFPFPSLANQARIIEKLDAVREAQSEMQSLYTRKLAALDELKQSLLRQAFNGQL